MPTIKELIEHLKGYDETAIVAYDLWQTDDVFQRAKERDIEISKEEAEAIIEQMDGAKDASLGLTWDTIDYYLDELEDSRGE